MTNINLDDNNKYPIPALRNGIFYLAMQFVAGRDSAREICSPSIPAKAGISAAIAAFADRRPFRFAEFPADAGRDSRFRGNGMFFCFRQKKHSHPPPLAGGGKNSRQRIFGGWRSISHQRSFKHHRRLSTPRDRFRARTPPRKRRGVK